MRAMKAEKSTTGDHPGLNGSCTRSMYWKNWRSPFVKGPSGFFTLFRTTSDAVEGGSSGLSDSKKVAASTPTTRILKSASWAFVHLAGALADRGYCALVVE